MPQEIKLKISGIGIAVEWEGCRIIDSDHILYRDFIIKDDDLAEVRLKIQCDILPEYPLAEKIFDALQNHWRLYQYNNKYIIDTFSPTPPYYPKKIVAVMEKNFTYGDVYIQPTDDQNLSWSLLDLMDPFGKLLIVNRLSMGEGILAHGLGVNDQGKGIVFLGFSGSGKSTLANLYKEYSQDSFVLNDEYITIKKRGNQFWLYGTPWPGEASTVIAQPVELKNIFFIEHAPDNKLISEPASLFLRRILQLLFLPFWNREGLDFTLRFCEELVKSLPTYKLGFVNDRRIIDFVRESQNSSHKHT